MPAGLILAGGRSNRFGSDKSLALLDGRSLLELAALALEPYCAPLAVSAAPGSGGAEQAARLGLEVLHDRPDDAPSPLAGIRAGLEWIAGLGIRRLAVRAVDTPFARPALLARLTEAIGPPPAAYCVPADGPQPLCSIWSLDALPPLAEALTHERHLPIHRFLDSLGAAAVRTPDAGAFANVNTREDLRLAQSGGGARWWRDG